MPRRKKSKLTKAREKALKQLSRYVRSMYADEDGNCTCSTCGKVSPWSALGRGIKAGDVITVGHFMPKKRCPELAFEIKNVAPQCWNCNNQRLGNGEQYALGLFLENVYGRDAVIDILNKYRSRAGGYKGKIEYYEEKYKELKLLADVNIKNRDLVEKLK